MVLVSYDSKINLRIQVLPIPIIRELNVNFGFRNLKLRKLNHLFKRSLFVSSSLKFQNYFLHT